MKPFSSVTELHKFVDSHETIHDFSILEQHGSSIFRMTIIMDQEESEDGRLYGAMYASSYRRLHAS